MEEKLCFEFAMDLTREECITYHELTSRTVGSLRGLKGRVVLSLTIAGLLLGLFLFQWFRYRYFDLPMAVLSVGLILLSGYTAWIVPLRLRRAAGRQYDEAVEAGHCYYGEVTLTDDSITKTGTVTTEIPMDHTTVFIEDERMMVFLNRRGPSIVLPARCLTPNIALMARVVAQRQLPPMNCHLLARVKPERRRPAPSTGLPTVTLMEGRITYTTEEMIGLIRGRTLERYYRRLPTLGGISLVAGLLYGWGMTSPVAAVAVFLGCLAVLSLFTFLPMRRAIRVAYIVQVTSSYTLTDRGVRMYEGNHELLVPWSSVSHVYDRGDYAELQFKNGGFFRIPKRELADVDAFEAILQQYWRNKR